MSIDSSTSSSTIPTTSSPESRSSSRSASSRAVEAPPPTRSTRRGARAAAVDREVPDSRADERRERDQEQRSVIDAQTGDPETDHRESGDTAERRNRRDGEHADGETHRARSLCGAVADRRPDHSGDRCLERCAAGACREPERGVGGHPDHGGASHGPAEGNLGTKERAVGTWCADPARARRMHAGARRCLTRNYRHPMRYRSPARRA